MPNVNQIAIIDCQVAGISGDMFLGALLDLKADPEKVIAAIESLRDFIECGNLKVEIKDVTRRGFRAKKVDVEADKMPEMKAAELVAVIEECAESLKLSDRAKRFASKAINTLLSSEAKLHEEDLNKIHLHEVGQIDTPAEIIGSAVALEDLGIFNSKVYSTPLAVGGGLFKFSHGTVSSPAPATLEILRSRKFPLIGGPIESELATPTGASILVNLVDEVTLFYPAVKPMKVGYGAGTKDFKAVPNVLRIVIGEPVDYHLFKDEIVVLETNLDDVTGETLGHVMDKLLLEGARDVSIIPMFTKKNRPGQILKVITDRENIERLSRLLIEETGSLGVRMYPCERRILARELIPIEIEIDGSREQVRVKVARDRKNKIVQLKPEYDDVKRIADRTSKPLRKLMEMVESKARKVLKG
jgi:hypothetical protein